MRKLHEQVSNVFFGVGKGFVKNTPLAKLECNKGFLEYQGVGFLLAIKETKDGIFIYNQNQHFSGKMINLINAILSDDWYQVRFSIKGGALVCDAPIDFNKKPDGGLEFFIRSRK